MLTPFGKEIRKIRIDQGVSLKNMAENIGVSSAYISAVETGKKNVTDELLNQICKALGLDSLASIQKLKSLAELSKDKISIELEGKCERQREIATVFARNFDKFNSDDLDSFMKILQKK